MHGGDSLAQSDATGAESDDETDELAVDADASVFFLRRGSDSTGSRAAKMIAEAVYALDAAIGEAMTLASIWSKRSYCQR